MAGEHAPEDREGALLGLCMGASKADQAPGTMLACGQSAKMRSHVTQVADRGKGSPLLCGRVLQAIFAIVCVVQAADRLPVLFDEPRGIELSVDHHSIRGGVAEQCLDDMHGSIVIQMFGGKHPAAVVREQHERRTVGTPGFSKDGEFTNAAANGRAL